MPRSRTTVAAIAAFLAGAGCRDTSAPNNKPLVVTVSIDATSQPTITDTPNGPVIRCQFSLLAQGTGVGTATWGGATTFWFFGKDRSTPLDTTTNGSSEVQGAFGNETITGGETQHGSWYLYAGAPFDATLGFAYNSITNGQTSVASTHITCGQKAQDAVVPSVPQITLPSTSGELEIGDTVSVTYHETGTSGIWLSVIDATGSFISEQVVGEHMASTVDRTVKFIVPIDVNPGVPLTISVRGFNSALQGAGKSLETQLKYVDRIPPTISQASVVGYNSLTGQFAVGDTIALYATATDDRALGWLVYELGAPANIRDSVAANPSTASQGWVVKLAVRPEWVGSPIVSMYARDASGLTSQTVSSQPDSVRFYPIVSHATTAPLTLSSQNYTSDMVYDAKRDLMYIGVYTENRIQVLSPSTMTLRAPIVLPGMPMEMDLSLSGDSLLVAVPSANAVAVVDLTDPSAAPSTIRLSVLDTTALSPGVTVQPSGLRISANGKMFVMMTNMTAAGDQTVEVDLATGAQKIRTDARKLSTWSSYWPQFMGRNTDRSRIYVLGINCWSWYVATTDAFTPCIGGISTDYMGMTFNATDTRMTRGSYVLDADTHTLWGAGPINHVVPYAALSPDGASVYLGAGQGITMMRFADTTMLERIAIPLTAERLFVAPSGAWVLAFQNTSGARVTRVDLQ